MANANDRIETAERARRISESLPGGSVLADVRRKLEEARARPRYTMWEDGQRPTEEVEIGAITWGRKREDAKMFYALHQCGWSAARVRSELTVALADKGADFVRGLLRDLVMQASLETRLQPGSSESDAETFRDELRLASGCPFVRLKYRLRAKEQFVREMLAPISSPEYRLNQRMLDPVPNWLALEVAIRTLAKPREFLLWDPSRISSFTVISADGVRHSGDFALLDRGDRVEVYICGGESPTLPDFTAEVSWDGRFLMPAEMPVGANPIYAIRPGGDDPEILWEDYGLDLYELYFGRVDRIQYDPVWPPAWLAAVEDRLCDMAAEAAGHNDAYDWEP